METCPATNTNITMQFWEWLKCDGLQSKCHDNGIWPESLLLTLIGQRWPRDQFCPRSSGGSWATAEAKAMRSPSKFNVWLTETCSQKIGKQYKAIYSPCLGLLCCAIRGRLPLCEIYSSAPPC